MSFLETIGLLTIIFLGFIFLGNLLEKIKRNDIQLKERLRANEEAVAEYHELEEKNRQREKEKELVAKAIIEKQNAFFNKWKNVDPEEEYLIRIGKIKSSLFNLDLYKVNYPLLPWVSSVEKEKFPLNKHKHKKNLFIKVDDIIDNYKIPVQTLELLYRGYIYEYHNDERGFTDEELKMENYVSIQTIGTQAEKTKANSHQITLNKIIKTLEELRQIGIEKNKIPVYNLE